MFGLLWSSVYVCMPQRGSARKSCTLISFSHVPKKHMWLAEDLTPLGEEIKKTGRVDFSLLASSLPCPHSSSFDRPPCPPSPNSAIKAEVYKLLPAKKL